MAKLIDSEDYFVRFDAILIISKVVSAYSVSLKKGEKHPYHHQLISDGIITKLDLIFAIQGDFRTYYLLSLIISHIFKACPLPHEVCVIVVKILKIGLKLVPCFELLNFLAESPDNHNEILADNFEQKLLETEKKLIEQLDIILSILQLGSNENKRKIAIALKKKVELLTDNHHIKEMIEKYAEQQYYEDNLVEDIKSKAIKALSLINMIVDK